MASPARITEILPDTLPGDFVEWDEGSPSAQPVQSGSGEPGPGVGVVSKPATQAAEARRAGAPSGNLPRGAALSVSALENTGGAVVPRPAQSLSPALLSSRDIVVLVVILAVAMIPVFISEPGALDGYRFLLGRAPAAKPAAAPAPTMTTMQQTEDAAPTRAHSTLIVPASTAAATTAGEVQISSEAARRPVQKDARPSREQAQMMDDQLHRPTRLQMKASLAEQAPLPPGGFAAADIDGFDNSKAIGAVFGGPKQPAAQIGSQQAISVPSGVALGLLVQKTQPVYPSIAKEGQVSGTIVMAATISKTGNVENLRVVSGPVMLRMSAVNAVRTWHFKPYMLNNQPTAIETTINVHFCGQAEPCVPGHRE
jgi:TonB family protein